MQIQNIAIDGPVASGKTVAGRLVAQKLGWRFLDTGSMYRVVTWVALARQLDFDDEQALVSLATQMDFRLEGEAGERVLADGKDVTDSLRAPEVDRAVSKVAKVAGVRVTMVARQREVALQAPTVVVGRDIGTKVLPDAPVKVFLTASVEERATRRHKELSQKGGSLSYEEVRNDLERRDRIDTEREASPLMAATDAVTLNTDALTIDQVVKRIMEMANDAAS
ncbi:MAG: cytidylate kinase [Chloroflexi bacterium]|jgi:cytidylate kinase|nr:MAG: cytidylate kinase [Chloroflexota bacterium]